MRNWDNFKTAADISGNYGIRLIGSESNLQDCWLLKNDYTDETSNENNLNSVNDPVFSSITP